MTSITVTSDTRRGHLKTRTRTRWVKFVGRTSCPSRIEFEPLSPAWTDKMSVLHLVGLRHSLASSVRLKPSLRLRITNRLAEDIRRAIAFSISGATFAELRRGRAW